MEVSNFATFSNKVNDDNKAQVIGPFTQFTGVLGPNGSGKSNLFDGIAFALNL